MKAKATPKNSRRAGESIAELARRLMVSPEVAAVVTRLNPVEQLKVASEMNRLAGQLRRLALETMEDLPELEALVDRLWAHNPSALADYARRMARIAEVAAQARDSRERKMAPLAARLLNGINSEQN